MCVCICGCFVFAYVYVWFVWRLWGVVRQVSKFIYRFLDIRGPIILHGNGIETTTFRARMHSFVTALPGIAITIVWRNIIVWTCNKDTTNFRTQAKFIPMSLFLFLIFQYDLFVIPRSCDVVLQRKFWLWISFMPNGESKSSSSFEAETMKHISGEIAQIA